MFVGANKNPEIVALEETKHKTNYFIGNNKTDWKSNIRTSKAILYKNIYKNIDLKVYGVEQQIEYDWIVKPGGNPDDIRFKYENVKKTEIDKEGNLMVSTKFGELKHKSPICFQMSDNKKIPVNGEFLKCNVNQYKFKIGAYDRNLTLVIDPLVQLYGSYFAGGSGYSIAPQDIVVNDEGCIYVLGSSPDGDFPVSYDLRNLPCDTFLFVIKFSSDGQSIIFSTIFGGSSTSSICDSSLDHQDNIYIFGTTWATNFPTTEYALQMQLAGNLDTYILKLSSNGET